MVKAYELIYIKGPLCFVFLLRFLKIASVFTTRIIQACSACKSFLPAQLVHFSLPPAIIYFSVNQ